MRSRCGFVALLALAFCPVRTAGQERQERQETAPGWERVRLGVTEGLSDNNVWHVCRDRRGFLWVATQYGVNRWDGYEFRTFTYDPADTSSLSANWVYFTFEERSGLLWFGTYGGGVCRFDPRTERFTRFGHSGLPGHLSDDHATCAAQDRTGKLWFGTVSGGLNRFDPETGQFTAFPADRSAASSETEGVFPGPPSPHINALLAGPGDTLWVGTYAGLFRFDLRQNAFAETVPVGSAEPGRDLILDLRRGPDGALWVKTPGAWHRFHPERRRFEPADFPGLPPGIPDGRFHTDAAGSVWVASFRGVEAWHPYRNPFALDRGRRYPAEAFAHEKIRSLLEFDGFLWLAGEAGLFRCRLGQPGAPLEKVLDRNVHALLVSDERLWAASLDAGLFRIDAGGSVRHYPARSNGRGPGGNVLFCLARDAWGFIWIGGDGVLDRFDPQEERFFSFLRDGNSNDRVLCLYGDRRNRLWIGTGNGGLGLQTFNPSGHPVAFQYFRHDPADSASLSSNIVMSLWEDRQGNLWVGTDGGLNLLEAGLAVSLQPEGPPPRFRRYLRRHGLGDDKIMSVRDDARGNSWIALLSHGLARLHPATGALRHFGSADGLPAASFYWTSAWQRPDGALLYGTTGGMAVFHPDSLEDRRGQPPPLYFTDVRVFDKNLEVGAADSPLNSSPLSTPELIFRHGQNILTFRFAALNFIHPEQNRYVCRLEPLDDAWRDLGDRREVTFSHLPPGRYTLRVKACGRDGVWNEAGAAMPFRILPPWWQSAWAYAAYGLALAAGAWTLFRLQLKRQLERGEAARLRELDALKTRLFANITHEFRTPLTLILGPLQRLKNKFRDADLPELGWMERNASRLLELVNQLLDLNKLEAGMMRPQWTRCDLGELLQTMVEPFRAAADAARIRLDLILPDLAPSLITDPDKLAKITGNLLSNALRATPAGGRVTLQASLREQALLLEVADTGRGIAAENLPRIFDRFYRVGDTGETGTGIGLALVRELVQLLGGTVEVESKLNEGSRFRVLLPLRQPEPGRPDFAPTSFSTDPPGLPLPAASPTPLPSRAATLPLALIVEDNADMSHYLAACLSAGFRLDLAPDGRSGLAKARARVPDLVVSDVMMPGMDGYELCGELKSDFRTSHIPVVLLTAKGDLPARLEGYRRGADAYLAKPFHEAELLAQAFNLIALRRRLWEKFNPAVRLAEAPVSPEEADPETEFVRRLQELLDKNLDNEHFSVIRLARDLAMSRTQLHRKVQSLTGSSAGRLLQNLRLERARQLLSSTDLSVGEVAFRCGFSDPNYFTRLFVRTQGCTPTEYGAR